MTHKPTVKINKKSSVERERDAYPYIQIEGEWWREVTAKDALKEYMFFQAHINELAFYLGRWYMKDNKGTTTG